MQNPSALIHSHDVKTLPDKGEGWWFPNYLYGRCDSTHLGDRKFLYHFTPLTQCTKGNLVLYWLFWSAQRDWLARFLVLRVSTHLDVWRHTHTHTQCECCSLRGHHYGNTVSLYITLCSPQNWTWSLLLGDRVCVGVGWGLCKRTTRCNWLV